MGQFNAKLCDIDLKGGEGTRLFGQEEKILWSLLRQRKGLDILVKLGKMGGYSCCDKSRNIPQA